MELLIQHPWIIGLILIWTLPWKAAALWTSARRGHLGWFLTLVILNTLAILDIIYLLISKPRPPKQQETETRQAPRLRAQTFSEQTPKQNSQQLAASNSQSVKVRPTIL